MENRKRNYCGTCNYPVLTCVCSAINSLDLPIEIIVIQHVKEAKHAKNTVRLAQLITPSITIHIANNVDAINSELRLMDKTSTAVLYPSQESTMIESFHKTSHNIKTVILLDGTWKQAYAMWMKYPLLQSFVSLHFGATLHKQYDIRKSKKTNQVSSIEAIAYAVENLCDINTSSYIKALSKLKDNWRTHSS